jgi:ribosomal protein S18 acetylase RimI-like enzyme
MSEFNAVRYRRAEIGDAPAMAALHADSWRRNYRGAYTDEFLDGDVESDRLATWTSRLATPRDDTCALVADAHSGIVGFAFTTWDEDARWGALLENLHVVHDQKRRGVGTQLMAMTAQLLLDRLPATSLYLWVLEQNTAAQAFYEARGAIRVEQGYAPPPGNDLPDSPARRDDSGTHGATLRSSCSGARSSQVPSGVRGRSFCMSWLG